MNASSETWIPVQGFKGFYEVSNLGRIRYTASAVSPWHPQISVGAIKRTRITKNGYVTIAMAGESPISVHRIVAKAFIPNPLGLPTVNHINGIKSDNRAENLEWASASDQMQHAYRLKLLISPRGTRHHASVLTDDQVLEIRKRYKFEKGKKLSEEFGVTHQTISKIGLSQRWKWLK